MPDNSSHIKMAIIGENWPCHIGKLDYVKPGSEEGFWLGMAYSLDLYRRMMYMWMAFGEGIDAQALARQIKADNDVINAAGSDEGDGCKIRQAGNGIFCNVQSMSEELEKMVASYQTRFHGPYEGLLDSTASGRTDRDPEA